MQKLRTAARPRLAQRKTAQKIASFFRADADKPKIDAAKFVRRADNLLGLIGAHFEEEEEVLLPLIDKGMSKAQFERELGPGAAAH